MLNAVAPPPAAARAEVATLDRLSGGRVELGLGAGHTPAEFAAAGVPFVSAAERKARLADVVEVAARAARRRDRSPGPASSSPWRARRSARPCRRGRVPILVGGSGANLLAHAARHADIVGLTGLGRTLPDGHRHAVRFQPSVLDADVRHRPERPRPAGPVELNVLVQVVDITDDRRRRGDRSWPTRIEDLTVDDALATPFLALGTHDEIAEQLRRAEERWGIGYVVVRDAEAIAPGDRPPALTRRRSHAGTRPSHGPATMVAWTPSSRSSWLPRRIPASTGRSIASAPSSARSVATLGSRLRMPSLPSLVRRLATPGPDLKLAAVVDGDVVGVARIDEPAPTDRSC